MPLTVVAVLVTIKIVKPRLGKYTGPGIGEGIHKVTEQESRAIRWAMIALAIKGADALEASGLPIPVVLVLFVIMSAFINLLIGGFGTLMVKMLSYTLAFFCFMTVQLLVWFFLKIPFGPGGPSCYSKE